VSRRCPPTTESDIAHAVRPSSFAPTVRIAREHV
jgi:hypothetical protein